MHTHLVWQMSNGHLASESRSDERRELRSLGHNPTYFQWENGHVTRVFLSDDDTTFASNIKKGVINMFQLKPNDAQLTEVRLHDNSLPFLLSPVFLL